MSSDDFGVFFLKYQVFPSLSFRTFEKHVLLTVFGYSEVGVRKICFPSNRKAELTQKIEIFTIKTKTMFQS